MKVRVSTVDQLLEDFEELGLGDFSVAVLVDGLDELMHLLVLDLSVAAQALECVVDETEDLIALQCPVLIDVVFTEDGINGLPQLVVTRLRTHPHNNIKYIHPHHHLHPLPPKTPSFYTSPPSPPHPHTT